MCGVVGALAPELVRWYRGGTINRTTSSIPTRYVLISIGFFLLGGFVAVVLPASTPWGAFYTGISAPILVSNIAGIPRAPTKDDREQVRRAPDAAVPVLPSRHMPTVIAITKTQKETGRLRTIVKCFDSREVMLSVQPDDTILAIKEQVCRTLGIDFNVAFLAYGGHSLDDSSSVADVGLGENSELLLLVRGTVGCIAKGTEVSLTKGDEKKVENLRIGDKVLSWDTEKSRIVEGTIVFLKTDKSEDALEVNEQLIVTQRQLVFTPSGWKSASQLDENDKIGMLSDRSKLSYAAVKTVRKVGGSYSVYDMKIVPVQTYFGNGILLYDLKPTLKKKLTVREWLGLITPTPNVLNPTSIFGGSNRAASRPSFSTKTSADRTELLEMKARWEEVVREAEALGSLTEEQRSSFLAEARKRIEEIDKKLAGS